MKEVKNLEDFAKSGVLPLRVSATGAEGEPLLEVTICDSISGGANEFRGMPYQLTLVRRNCDGNEIRQRYTQASI